MGRGRRLDYKHRGNPLDEGKFERRDYYMSDGVGVQSAERVLRSSGDNYQERLPRNVAAGAAAGVGVGAADVGVGMYGDYVWYSEGL